MFKVPRVNLPMAEIYAPNAALWHRLPSVKIKLMAAPVAMQPSKYVQAKWKDERFGQLRVLGFQAAHDGTELALRLEWQTDEPPRRTHQDNNEFPDAAALLFPLHEHAPIFMGAQDAPVSIWHWKDNGAPTAAVNLAQGIGSSTVQPEQNISVAAQWQDGHWQVVFRRLLMPPPIITSQPGFVLNTPQRIGFAVWDGYRQERAGLKAFSPNWTEFSLAT
ncbi:putative ethylbenzene dehydrogenase-like gamma-subunit [Denitratisoma oestradiolicum]|uniref:Putative ethylbenzene dehydrogenase-like gamma-subunit n=2 Tax=Denitratisoma oestradiolicum TaxID=311182 RepID=A0A6S6Y1S6_9PROT|nr:hypothetical protein CBW56_02275 [Denitratisoma oestradiolicum]CAB1369243.1 putative ethylbenzene dehydrogenase-like gamma-subunit [Denitratisoma oestradiolicum]